MDSRQSGPRQDSGISDKQRKAFLAVMAESMRWSKLEITLGEASAENSALCADLVRFDRSSAVALLAGMLAVPELQSNCIRLELLVALALMHCQGTRSADRNDAARWFLEIGKSRCVSGEDPAEDVFVTLIRTRSADYKVLEGIWESAGFYTQRLVNVVETMPDEEPFGNLKKATKAMLAISNLACSKAGLRRYQEGAELPRKTIVPAKLKRKDALVESVTIHPEELASLGFSKSDVEPFILPNTALRNMEGQMVGASAIDRRPLIDAGDRLIVALPTAISTAVREFAIWMMSELGAVDQFDASLAAEYADLITTTSLLGDIRGAPIAWTRSGQFQLATFATEIDKGYVLDFHFLLPSISLHDRKGFKAAVRFGSELGLEKAMQGAEASFSKDPEFRKGIHFLIGCGWGAGYEGTLERMSSSRWKRESLSIADLVRMSELNDMTARNFWRFEEGLNAVGRHGVEIMNLNGVLNMVAWMRHNQGHFVPHEQLPAGRISPDRPLTISPPQNLLRGLRAQVDLEQDRHSEWDQEGVWHPLQRANPFPYFPSESQARVYACLDCVERKRLVGFYDGRHKIWFELLAPEIKSLSLKYELWKLCAEWLHRVGAYFDERSKSGGTFHLDVHFDDPDGAFEDIDAAPPPNPIEYCTITVERERSRGVIRLRDGFVHAFRSPKNSGEGAIAECMIRALVQIIDDNDVARKVEEICACVVVGERARSFHLFQTHGHLDYVHGDLPEEVIAPSEIDDAITRLGLGWRGHVGEADTIEGVKECTALLNRVVDILVEDIASNLQRFERSAVIERLLTNCMRVMVEEQRWKRTSAAVLALHGTTQASVGRAIEEISRLASASTCGRALVEMAVCECPEEGAATPADMELGDLLAKVALLIRIGGLSDGIHFNLLTPRIRISALGDLLFQDDFGNEVVEPTLTETIGRAFVSQASMQERFYSPPEEIDSTRSHFGEQFWEAWIAETGVDIDTTRKILDVLELEGIRLREPILRLRRSQIVEACRGHVEPTSVQRFVEQYELAPRKRWSRPPAGFAAKEIFPWRFGRRLSMVSRPLVRMSDEEDPMYLVAPSMLRRGVLHILQASHLGTLDQSFFVSGKMRDEWRGRAGEGHTFNRKVAAQLENAGWIVRQGIGLPEVLRRKMDRDFGDLDILAWKAGVDQIWVGECKDVSTARNYSEVAAMLSDYQGKKKNGKPDKLLRHLERVRLLQDNRIELSRFTGILSPSVSSALYFNGTVPMQFARIDALKDSFIGDAASFLARGPR